MLAPSRLGWSSFEWPLLRYNDRKAAGLETTSNGRSPWSRRYAGHNVSLWVESGRAASECRMSDVADLVSGNALSTKALAALLPTGLSLGYRIFPHLAQAAPSRSRDL